MHEITLLQGLSLAALVFVLGIDFWLEALFLFRPIIVCTLTGAILGDIQTGLITGGLTELAFAGLTPAGGVQPPNPIMAGLMTTVIAWSTGVDAKTAIGLGLPFSLLMQYVILFFYSAFSLFMTKADKCAKEADTAAFSRLNWTTMLIVASAYAVIAFLCTYLAQGAMQALVKAMPAWLTHGFEVAGGILPAVGFGLLLRVMFKAQYIPYLIAGFLFVPKMLGYDEYAVLSGSMEPGIPVGAIVYDKNFTGSEARDGVVVTYQLPAGTLVTHRIISVDKEEQTVVTQGDANNIADTALVAWQQIVGVYAFHIPYLGYISIYAKTPLGIAVVCGVLIVLILLNFIPDILEEDKKKNLKTE